MTYKRYRKGQFDKNEFIVIYHYDNSPVVEVIAGLNVRSRDETGERNLCHSRFVWGSTPWTGGNRLPRSRSFTLNESPRFALGDVRSLQCYNGSHSFRFPSLEICLKILFHHIKRVIKRIVPTACPIKNPEATAI